MQQKPFGEEDVGTSKFYMLRCLIAMAHADGIVCDQERAYMSALISRLPLNHEQRATLESDLDNEQPIESLLPYINDPKFRGQIPYFARLMAMKDGVMHPEEDALLKKMHAFAIDGLDMDQIRKETQKAVQAEMFIHDITIDNNRPHKGGHLIPWFQWLDELLLFFGIDIMGN